MRIIQIDITKDFSEAIREVVKVLTYGGTVVYPTDTLYGLGANALNEIAIRKIFAIKERGLAKPLPIIVRNLVWAKELAFISPKNEKILEKVWPPDDRFKRVGDPRSGAPSGIVSGKVTAVLPRDKIIPDAITGGGETVGMRVADHPFTDELLGKFGYPLTATSANLSGEVPTSNINEIIATFSKMALKPDLIIDAGTLPPSSPSTVIDLTGDEPKILRIGATNPKELLELLKL